MISGLLISRNSSKVWILFLFVFMLTSSPGCSEQSLSQQPSPDSSAVSYTPGPREVVKIIDPDNGPGTDYTSLEEFTRREKRDLVSAGEIAVAVCRSTQGSPDGPAQFDGWVTDREHYVKVVADEDHRAGAKWDDAKYRIIESSTLNSECIDVEIDNIVIDGIQMMLTGSGRSHDIIDPEPGDLFIIKNCFMRISLSTGSGDAVDLKSEAYMYNNIMECSVSDSGRLTAIIAYEGAGVKVYNNTITGFHRAFKNEGKITAVNNLIRGAEEGFETSDDGFFTSESDYNSSNILGDALVKAPRSNIESPWYNGGLSDDAIFMDAAAHDYRLKPNTVLLNAGIGPASDPNVPAETIEGTPRSGQTTSIGAY
jgi:hypothetical protein